MVKIAMRRFDVSHKWNHVHNWFMYIMLITNHYLCCFAYIINLQIMWLQIITHLKCNDPWPPMRFYSFFKKWRYYYVIQNFFDWCFSKNLHNFVECKALKVHEEPFIFLKKNLWKKIFCTRIIPSSLAQTLR